MNRRRLLLSAALSVPALTTGGRLLAAAVSQSRFLLIFLRGGYDCASLLVPWSSSYYYEARPNIAIARPADAGSGALRLDDNWALAPAVRDSLGPLYAASQLAFVPFAGIEDLSRSHFETQDNLELGQALPAAHDFRSGFLARLASVITGNPAIAFTDSLPLVFKGDADIPNISLKGLGRPVFDDRQARILTGMYAGHHLRGAIADGLELRQEVSRTMEDEMQAANRGATTAKGFELEARRIGRLMREQYRIGFVDIGGWDTHVNQGAAEGALANNLENLGRGLVALRQELAGAWDDTVVIVVSEFGRTFRENGNRGTDHGHASVYWVLGGAVNGGRIAGEQVHIDRSSLFQDRDYPVLNDCRGILGGVFRQLWPLTNSELERVFPASRALDLNLVRRGSA